MSEPRAFDKVCEEIDAEIMGVGNRDVYKRLARLVVDTAKAEIREEIRAEEERRLATIRSDSAAVSIGLPESAYRPWDGVTMRDRAAAATISCLTFCRKIATNGMESCDNCPYLPTIKPAEPEPTLAVSLTADEIGIIRDALMAHQIEQVRRAESEGSPGANRNQLFESAGRAVKLSLRFNRLGVPGEAR